MVVSPQFVLCSATGDATWRVQQKGEGECDCQENSTRFSAPKLNLVLTQQRSLTSPGPSSSERRDLYRKPPAENDKLTHCELPFDNEQKLGNSLVPAAKELRTTTQLGFTALLVTEALQDGANLAYLAC
jgi:hypothetical protein